MQIQKRMPLPCQIRLGREHHSSKKLASLMNESEFHTMKHSIILRYNIAQFTEFVKPKLSYDIR